MDFCVDVIGNSVSGDFAGICMPNLAAAEPARDRDEAAAHGAAAKPAAAGVEAARIVARARWLLIISGLTTMIAIAAVLAVIGYRVFHGRGSGTAASGDAIIVLPEGARVLSTAVAGDRVVVTLDIAGATEIRSFDVRTLKEIGRIRFATEP
jgi:hypothetical protein